MQLFHSFCTYDNALLSYKYVEYNFLLNIVNPIESLSSHSPLPICNSVSDNSMMKLCAQTCRSCALWSTTIRILLKFHFLKMKLRILEKLREYCSVNQN